MAGALDACHLAQSWNINVISEFASAHTWMIATIPIGFIISVIGLMGNWELAPFDAPEAESEIVSGALSEYSAGWGLFRIAKDVELVIGISLIVTFYLGGFGNLVSFLLKSLGFANNHRSPTILDDPPPHRSNSRFLVASRCNLITYPTYDIDSGENTMKLIGMLSDVVSACLRSRQRQNIRRLKRIPPERYRAK
jgi:hypothetical protein